MARMTSSARLRALAVVAGAGAYALALPPFDHAALAWLTLVPLLLVVRTASPRHAFAWGALYGFAAAWTATWWLAQAVARYFAAGILPAALAMSAAYGVAVAATFGLFAAGAALVVARRGTLSRRLVTVPALWTAVEVLRARVLGQPWALLGYTQHAQIGLIQVAAVTGVYGVSFLVALGNAAIVEALVALREGRGRREAGAALAVPAAVIGGVWLIGMARALAGPAGGFAAQPVAVVQTGVPPAFHWTRAYAEQQLMAHVRATEALPIERGPALIIWPENALTLYLENEPLVARQLARLATRHRADLLFGRPRYADGHTFNSATLLRASGESGGHYDKQRLVLFAEAGPLAAPPPEAANESPRDFTAGTAPGVLQSFVPLGVSICHEILYPDLIGRAVAAGASLLVNISNDGWLDGGYGAASRQHFAMAVFRAVETRRYLVRAATTGVSGIVDPFGRVVETVAPGAVGAVTGVVAARGELTPYVRFGDAFALLCILHIAALIATTLTSARTPRAPEAVPTFPQDTAVDTKRHAA
ncbi:MAG: apolipoprotein N-acyltransferase [Deltaproteobacteria bacterium]|nr:MAG: apolipoprotein N-acyltransferase [Deltaproteobacteria bacterium]